LPRHRRPRGLWRAMGRRAAPCPGDPLPCGMGRGGLSRLIPLTRKSKHTMSTQKAMSNENTNTTAEWWGPGAVEWWGSAARAEAVLSSSSEELLELAGELGRPTFAECAEAKCAARA